MEVSKNLSFESTMKSEGSSLLNPESTEVAQGVAYSENTTYEAISTVRASTYKAIYMVRASTYEAMPMVRASTYEDSALPPSTLGRFGSISVSVPATNNCYTPNISKINHPLVIGASATLLAFL